MNATATLRESCDAAVVDLILARAEEARRIEELRLSAVECPRCGDSEWIYDPEIDGHYCLACEHAAPDAAPPVVVAAPQPALVPFVPLLKQVNGLFFDACARMERENGEVDW